MALTPFNVAGGLSVGETPITVFNANGALVGNAAAPAGGNLTVVGNIVANNITAIDLFIGNVDGNISGNIVIPGPDTGVVFKDGSNANSNVNLTFNKTTQNLTANGNIVVTTGRFVGNGSGLTNIPAGNISGNLSNTDIPLANVTGAGNVAAANFNGNGSQFLAGNGAWLGISTSSIANGNSNITVTANGDVTINSGGNTIITATPTGADIPNLTVANLSVTTLANLGSITNVKIGGGTANYVIGTDGTGNLNWVQNFITVPGANGEILFSSNSDLAASPGLVFTSASNALAVGGDITSTSGNIRANAGAISANTLAVINSASIGGELTVSGNANIQTGRSLFVDNLGGRSALMTVTGTNSSQTLNAVGGNIEISGGAGNGTGTGGRITISEGVNGANAAGGGGIILEAPAGGIQLNGTVTVPGILDVGPVQTFRITGGANGQALVVANAANGYMTFANNFVDPAGVDTQVQFNDGGVFGGNASLTFNKTTGLLSATHILGEGGNISNIQGANVSGAVSSASVATLANVANTVAQNAQPNITSVGTLTSLTLGGTLTSNSNVAFTGAEIALGAISNVKVTGGTNGQFLTTDGNGNLSFSAVGAGSSLINGTSSLVFASADSNAVLTVNGNTTNQITFSDGTSNLGDVIRTTANIKASYFLGNFVGNVSGTLTVPGTNTSVIFNDQGAAGASSNFVFDKATNNATIAGNLTISVGTIGGDGSRLSNITGSNVTGAVANANVANTAGTVTANNQPNINSVGTLSSLAVNDTVVAVGFTANTGYFLGVGNGLSQLNGANVTGEVGFAAVANRVEGGNVIGAVTSANSAINITGAAQPNITSVGNLTSLVVSTTINAGTDIYANGQLYANVAQGTAPLVVNSTTKVANLNAEQLDGFDSSITNVANTVVVRNTDGNIQVGNVLATNVYANTGTVAATTLVGTLSTAAQPSITSVGTLTSLSVTGNATAGNVISNNNFVAGNSTIGAATTTTTSVATADLVKLPATPGRGVEFIVKGSDTTTGTYRISTVLAICGASGTIDYTEFGAVILGGGTGPGTVQVSSTDTGANLSLQVTPSSATSTVWTTQYRYI